MRIRKGGVGLAVAAGIAAVLAASSCAPAPTPPTPGNLTSPPPSFKSPAAATPSPIPALPTPILAEPDLKAGERAFYAAGCIGCHTVQGVGGRVGPELTDIAQRRDAAYIRESEINPKAYIVPGYPPVMPSAAELELSDQDVENIIGWFYSLR